MVPSLLLAVVATLRRWLRVLLVWYPSLPTAPTSAGNRDVLMLESDEEAVALAQSLSFPASFEWGTATAAFQVEGGIVDTNWNRWEQRKRRDDGGETVRNGHEAGKACDVWNRFEDDIELMSEIGIGIFRFSVEWSRVEPREGHYDEAAIDRYVDWCIALKAKGIKPCVSLLHFTEPGWFCDKGGWEVYDNSKCFGRFVRKVVPRLFSHVDVWCTLNEPAGQVVCGQIAGVHPPGNKDQLLTALRCAGAMLGGHLEASLAIQDAAVHAHVPTPPISIATNVLWFVPAVSPGGLFGRFGLPNPIVLLLSCILNTLYNFVIVDACTRGRLPMWPLPLDLLAALAGWRSRIRALKGSINFIGLNHYYRENCSLSFSPPWEPRKPCVADEVPGAGDLHLPMGISLKAAFDPTFEKSDMGWDLTPSSLGLVVAAFHERYGQPIFITESGIADGGEPDTRRVRYMAGVLTSLREAMRKGAHVRGYMYWSLMDNFEWAEGYWPRFGLYRVDYESDKLPRKPTKGHRLFKEIVSRHREAHAGEAASVRACAN